MQRLVQVVEDNRKRIPDARPLEDHLKAVQDSLGLVLLQGWSLASSRNCQSVMRVNSSSILNCKVLNVGFYSETNFASNEQCTSCIIAARTFVSNSCLLCIFTVFTTVLQKILLSLY